MPSTIDLDSIGELPISGMPSATTIMSHNTLAGITPQQERTQQYASPDMEIPTGPTTPQVPDRNEAPDRNDILAQIANEKHIPILDTPTPNNKTK